MNGKKILLAFLVTYLVATAAVIVYVLKFTNNNESLTAALSLSSSSSRGGSHLAGNRAIPLNKVLAKVVYFIPNDLVEEKEADWLATIDKTMNEEQRFYRFQLNGAIDFQYDIYESAVIGNKDHQFYDSTSTDRGNPHALISVREEIMRRIFAADGDLYRADFANRSNDYEFIIIIYGSTGASALIYKQNDGSGEDVVRIEDDGPPAIILSSGFLTSPLYREFGATVLAHEIGHAFGLTDSYDADTGSNLETDIMGEGRRRILTGTYISDKNKKLLGL
ncbi:MAG: hypothetical protein AAB467_02660 [Patescibacteria group bacterium]